MADREAAPTGLLPLYLAIGALFAALGLWVLAAAPHRNLNRALAAVLLLWAGALVAFQLMRDATSAEAFTAYRAVGSLYEVPTPFLFLYIVDELFLPKPRTAARKVALAGLAAFAVVVGAALLSHDWLGETAPMLGPGGVVLRPDGSQVFQYAYTLLPSLQAAAIFFAESVAAIVAARTAGRAPPGSIGARRAATVAIAFGFLAGHNAGLALGAPLSPNTFAALTAQPWPDLLLKLAGATGLAAAAYALPRVPRAWEGRARRLAAAAIVVPLLAGFFDLARDTLAPGFAPPFYNSTRFVWVSAFAIGLAVAVLRYDLAAAGTPRSARRAAATGALLAFGVAGIGAGYAVSALDVTPLGLAVGGVLLVSPAVLAMPRRLRGLVSLDASDPAVDRERARTYAAALRASPSRGADDAALRALRAELGLTGRDHALLLSVLDGAPEALAPGHVLLGRYRVVRELGRGGFGEAFLARDEREHRDVVLKRLAGERRRDAEALRRFRKEARLAGLLEHPHIVRVLGVEDVGGEPLLVMEYAPGGSLADRLRTGPLPEDQAVRVGTEVLDALGALHAAGIVHRDVKPSNILFDAEGHAKLGDFTIAREVISGETRGGAPGVQGTFPYLAPEQARGLPAGPAADLYALGATLYEAVSGAPPFDTDGCTEHEAATLVTQRLPRLPAPQASTKLNAALATALAKDPGDRFASASAMRAALGRASVATRPKGPRARTRA